MGKPVVHFEVLGKDPKKLQDFYGKLFDWNIDTNNPQNYGTVDNGGKGINGGIGPSQDGSKHVAFYVMVEDLQATLATAEKLGGKTAMKPMEVPGAGVTLAAFTDPEGNWIGLTKA